MEKIVTITVNVNDVENECQMSSEISLDSAIEIEKYGLDPIYLLKSKLSEEIDKRVLIKNQKIKLNEIYNLDLGSSTPITVIPIEFIGEDRVLCKYLNSYAERIEILGINMFKV